MSRLQAVLTIAALCLRRHGGTGGGRAGGTQRGAEQVRAMSRSRRLGRRRRGLAGEPDSRHRRRQGQAQGQARSERRRRSRTSPRTGARRNREVAVASRMRTLCLLLILANVLYFTWSQMIDVHVQHSRSQGREAGRAAGAHRARSRDDRSESRRAQRRRDPRRTAARGRAARRAIPHPATQTAQLDTLSCTSIGPFADLPQASQAQAALRAAGFQPRQRMEQGEIWAGYWVSVQGLATRDAAEAALKTLARQRHRRRVRDARLRSAECPVAGRVLRLPARATARR